ncbi:MAG: Tol-Pal system protein TolB [Hyphomicrobiales bacterium]|nr:Tol-Pal system protein TolB [Hyphomicrobiales bacterium]
MQYPLFTRLISLLLLALVMGFLPRPAAAVLKVNINQGVMEPMPIALPTLGARNAEDHTLGQQIFEVVGQDLKRSGLFKLVDPEAQIQQIDGVETIPRFPDWRQIGAQALVTGSISGGPGSKITVEFRLWDVLLQKQFAGQSFSGTRENWRRVAHLIADVIYTRLTGERGYFDSRIVFISETGPKRRPQKRLTIMDQDGANVKTLTSGRDLVLTPRFDPNSQRIIYLSYIGRQPKVYIYDLANGRQEVLGRFPGMTFAPRFSPDGQKAILSASLDGNSEIYVVDLNSKAQKRLTNHPAIDTSPSFAPDMQRVVFNSDRDGSQQLYVMSADGSSTKRISYGDGSYATPVWSPRGDLVAFTKMYAGRFYIGVMRPDGSGERLLAEGFLVEGPTWAPNGRVLMFTRQEPSRRGQPGKSFLFTIDLTGYNEQLIQTPTEASDPAWSPLLSK